MLENIQASRCVSVAGLMVLLYDHALTFSEEVELIWKGEWKKAPKALFLLLRYCVPTVLIIILSAGPRAADWMIHRKPRIAPREDHLELGFAPRPPDCKGLIGTSIFLELVTIGSADFLVLLHLRNLWEHNELLMYSTKALYYLMQLAEFLCVFVISFDMLGKVSYSSELQSCVLQSRSNMVLLWAPGLVGKVVFEAAICVLVVWTSLSKPRDTTRLAVVYRAGLISPLIILTLRIINMIIAAVAPLSLIFLGVFFPWAATTTTVTRMILRSRRLSVINTTKRGVLGHVSSDNMITQASAPGPEEKAAATEALDSSHSHPAPGRADVDPDGATAVSSQRLSPPGRSTSTAPPQFPAIDIVEETRSSFGDSDEYDTSSLLRKSGGPIPITYERSFAGSRGDLEDATTTVDPFLEISGLSPGVSAGVRSPSNVAEEMVDDASSIRRSSTSFSTVDHADQSSSFSRSFSSSSPPPTARTATTYSSPPTYSTPRTSRYTLLSDLTYETLPSYHTVQSTPTFYSQRNTQSFSDSDAVASGSTHPRRVLPPLPSLQHGAETVFESA
ncbi:hypothetical protein V5O48_014296 [Marasmius crinis-equi]|uniref:DUF6533 domain-containing protein n=1 Tax=Marasmius crinis-equi TaxID=585013 RepID=A0ABR3EXN9_9AGAR